MGWSAPQKFENRQCGGQSCPQPAFSRLDPLENGPAAGKAVHTGNRNCRKIAETPFSVVRLITQNENHTAPKLFFRSLSSPWECFGQAGRCVRPILDMED